ncbi:MAG: hypothetical protein JSV10_01880 [Candidatus Zixiibacteriota bacterium]|nr:MAG: hypothetical protein JSV10_01880 [candidate division Zixibacteria bacterium]
MRENAVSITDVCALTLYGLINALFVYKYAARITAHPWVTSSLYLVLLGLLVLLLYRKAELRLSPGAQNLIYFLVIVLFAFALTLVMSHFDPQKIRVGRYPALQDWISRLFDSEFPYNVHTRPSGFPFLFVMAMPFYLLGDLGFFQIFSFLIFAGLVYFRYREQTANRFRCIFLLMSAPVFLYEVMVRSELFSNMVMVMLYLAILEMVGRRMSLVALISLGLVGGLLLSTRGIALLIYVLVLGYFLKTKVVTHGMFFASICAGFLVSLLPFLIWDWAQFMKLGPLSKQLSFLPIWLLALSVVSSVYCALKIESLRRVYSAVSFTLFAVVLVAFSTSVLDLGWHQSVLGDGFDISYFAFAIPFLIVSLDFRGKEDASPVGVFANHPAGSRSGSNSDAESCVSRGPTTFRAILGTTVPYVRVQ